MSRLPDPGPGLAGGCEVCGGPLPSAAGGLGSAGGQCLRCLARGLLGGWETPAEPGAAEGVASSAEELVTGGSPGRLGDYLLEKELGHGGMGVVYRARQLSLGRTVALKLLLMGRFADAGSIQRFLREASAAAHLHHPNIVAIHEVGEQGGYHYYSMEYIEGPTLEERLQSGPLAPREAAALVRVLAEAVHHAHRHGVIHRDLKPSNVLFDGLDQPHVSDFGLAKRLDDAPGLTLSGELLGSPSYLSPEQAGGRQAEVGPGSDVYALGAILYQCLTGRPPFIAAGTMEVLERIRSSEPLAPKSLEPRVPMDLETIVLKCLEKKPARRYRTARELADDLGRFLAGHPTLARPVVPIERAWRWARRRPWVAGGLVLVVLTALITSISSYRAVQSGRSLQQANARLAGNLRRLQWEAAEDAVAEERINDALVIFARLLRDHPEDPVLTTRLVSLLTRRAFAIPCSPALTHERPLTSAGFGVHGDFVVTTSLDGTAAIWRTRDGTLLRRFVEQSPLAGAVLVRSGNQLLTVRSAGGARLWRVSDGAVVRDWAAPAGTPALLAHSPDGELAAVAVGPHCLEVVALASGEPVAPALSLSNHVTALAFGRDAGTLLTGTESGDLRLWRSSPDSWAEDGGTRLDSAVTDLVMTPDGARVLAGTRRGSLVVLRPERLQQPRVASRGGERIQFLECSPDGSRVVVSRFGEWPELLNLATLEVERVFRRTDSDIALHAAWSPEGNQLILGMRSGTATLYDAASGRQLEEPFEHQGPIVRTVFHPEGGRVLTASHDGSARLWDVRATRQQPPSVVLPGKAQPDLVTSDGRLLLVTAQGRLVQVWDAGTGQTVGEPRLHDAPVQTAVLAPDGLSVAVGAHGTWLWPVDGAQRRPVGPLGGDVEPVESLAWAPDGHWLVTGSSGGRLRRWDARSREPMGPAIQLDGSIGRVGVSPDGRRMVAICGDATARVVEVGAEAVRVAPLRHQGRIWTAEFSPDSRRLVTASVDRTAQVWDLATGRRLGGPLRHERAVLIARFSPDGRVIATGGEDRVVRLWDAATGRALTPPLRHGSRVWQLAFSESGGRLLTAADQGEVQIWNVAAGLPESGVFTHEGMMLRAWFSPGERQIVTVTHAGEMTRWSPLSAPAPGPAWLPELAEALAGRRMERDGTLYPASPVAFEWLVAPGSEGSQLPVYQNLADRFAPAVRGSIPRE